MRARGVTYALWLLGFAAVVWVGGSSMYHDETPAEVTRPAFTLFAVDSDGQSAPLAQFDGVRWRSRCDAAIPRGEGQEVMPIPPVERISGLTGSTGAPLVRVRELTGDSTGWEATADAVEVEAMARSGFDGPKVAGRRVYSADAAGSGFAYVDITLRDPASPYRGVVASSFVIADETPAPRLVDLRTQAFATYEEYLALERWTPIGAIDEGGERVWVVGVHAGEHDEIRLIELTGRATRERLRIDRGGC